VRDELSNDLEVKAVLHRSPKNPPSPVLGSDTRLLKLRTRKGVRAAGTENQGYKSVGTWIMGISRSKQE